MLGIVIGLLSGIFWAISGNLLGSIENSLNQLSEVVVFSLLVASIHDLTAGAVLFFLNAYKKKSHLYKESLQSPEFIKLCIGSLLGGPMGMLGYVVGVYMAGVRKALLITALYPLVSTLLSTILTKEKLHASIMIAVLCSVLGVYCATYLSSFSGISSTELLGLTLTFLAVIGWSFEGSLSFLVTKTLDTDIAIGFRELISGVVLLLFYMICIMGDESFILREGEWLWAIGAGVAGGISYRFWYQCIAQLGVAKAMVLNVTYVFWGSIFVSIFQSKPTTLSLIIGECLIVCSVICLLVKNNTSKKV